MNSRIEDLTGQQIVTEKGLRIKLVKQAGCGAQGIVYEEDSGKYMIKLYYPTGSSTVDEDYLDRLRFIRDINMPKNFVEIIDVIASPYIGYVMEKVVEHKPLNSYLIPAENLSFTEWFNKGLGLYERLFVGYIIAKSFAELEKSNLSYCDISGNNILVKVSKGASVKMIDIDNIYIAGKGKPAILGTPRYIAPEVINQQKNPDVLSDNYSLAVILFELLRVGHPYLSDEVLDGTPEEEDAALSGDGEYVNDENSTNMLPADVVFTDKLKSLFYRCFVDGKGNRLLRPAAIEFENALLEATNKLVKCPSCGAWHYPKKNGNSYGCCPWCDSASKPTAMLSFYDILFDGQDYKQAKSILHNGKAGKLVNSYIIKDGRKNYIKNLYILRAEDVSKEKRSSENYVTVASNSQGFHIYNEFLRPGIVVKKYGTNEYVTIGDNKSMLLHSGDEIYFEINGNATEIECGGRKYSFIRMARFSEVSK